VEATSLFEDARQLASHIRALRRDRRQRKLQLRAEGRKRQAMGTKNRNAVLSKTGGRCHICGGAIVGDWAADHVLAHAQGGAHMVDNYLPAHTLCNNYRWFYGTEEFQWILKLGVWLRTRIEHEDRRALELIEEFVRHEVRRHGAQPFGGADGARTVHGDRHDRKPTLA